MPFGIDDSPNREVPQHIHSCNCLRTEITPGFEFLIIRPHQVWSEIQSYRWSSCPSCTETPDQYTVNPGPLDVLIARALAHYDAACSPWDVLGQVEKRAHLTLLPRFDIDMFLDDCDVFRTLWLSRQPFVVLSLYVFSLRPSPSNRALLAQLSARIEAQESLSLIIIAHGR
ncbi:hypothetical protein AcW1_001401 [Taiwanofungus camphoratus]|nr:hypothetical protein AcV7_001426 [Antrodia cinnamomea]KAI0964624.1 hypothetical protein AcW1_001401 [Antrodia cinnamomea]